MLNPTTQRVLSFSLVLFGFAAPATAQGAFESCGTLVSSGACPIVFQADAGGLLELANYGSFQVGARVHVVGTTTICASACSPMLCIAANTIDSCQPCNCTPLCFGVGGAVACPCGTSGAANAGCANSASASGAQLLASGGSSLSEDELVLLAIGMPDEAAIYFQGTSSVEAVFGDGKSCVSGSIVRLGTKTNLGGTSSYPGVGEPRVALLGGILNPGTRYYQVWYRDSGSFCTTETFNLSNAVQIDWAL